MMAVVEVELPEIRWMPARQAYHWVSYLGTVPKVVTSRQQNSRLSQVHGYVVLRSSIMIRANLARVGQEVRNLLAKTTQPQYSSSARNP
jgi:hypothetical protein